MIGEFEYVLIAAAVRLGEQAYGAAIRAEIASSTGRNCSLGALYTTLDRLEAKDFYDAVTRVSQGVSWAGRAVSTQ
jgi:DNA-binding PadR family transcriptional regulator